MKRVSMETKQWYTGTLAALVLIAALIPNLDREFRRDLAGGPVECRKRQAMVRPEGEAEIVAAAKAQYHDEDTLEIDDTAIVSISLKTGGRTSERASLDPGQDAGCLAACH